MVQATATHRVLKFVLADAEGMEVVLQNPFVVSCANCSGTMWSFSENALVELESERIVCRSRDCAGVGVDAVIAQEEE